jgi:hypothetical protein
MKKVFLIIAMFFITTMSYSQDFKGLGGYLVVDQGVWTLTWQNNNYKILTDWAQIVLTDKNEVETFHNDLVTSFESKDEITIKREKYVIYVKNDMVLLYNNNEQYMTMVKKYMKKGIGEVKESILFMR